MLALTAYKYHPEWGTTVHLHGNCHYTATRNTWRPREVTLGGLDLVDTIYRSELKLRDEGKRKEAHFCHLCFPVQRAALRRTPTHQ